MDHYQELYKINRLTDAEAAATTAGVNGAVELASGIMGMFSTTATDIMSGGAGAIASAVEGIVSAVSTAVTDVMLGVQEAVTARRQITADEMNNLLNAKTTEWTNLPFLLIGAMAIILLLYIKSKK